MDPFLANAEQILDAAAGCAHAGNRPAAWTILLGAGGQVEMLAAMDWDLDALRRERGAAMAFRVAEAGGRIAVEGRAGARACRLERESPAAVARVILNMRPAVPAAARCTPAPALAAPAASSACPATPVVQLVARRVWA